MPLFFAEMPTMDLMYFVELGSRILHLLAAMIFMGGILNLRGFTANASSANEAVDTCAAGKQGSCPRKMMVLSLILITTGLYNFVIIIKSHDVEKAYHMLFGIKFLLAIFVMGLAAMLVGKSKAAQALKKNMSQWVTITILLIGLIVVLASTLRTLRTPKDFSNEKPVVTAFAS